MSLVVDMRTKLTGITSNIYLNDMPDTPDECIAIFNSGGPPTVHAMDQIACEQESFQVRVRHTSASTALQWCLLVQEALDGMHTETINSNYYLSVFQEGDIGKISRDYERRSSYVVNFIAKVKFA